MSYGNVEITEGSGTPIGVDTISAVDYQRVKVGHGAEGSITDASSASPLPVRQSGANASVTRLASSATSVQASAAADRRFWSFQNKSTQTAYIKFGATASITASSESFTVEVPAGAYYEMPAAIYTGRIDVIWASANGYAMVTEVTA